MAMNVNLHIFHPRRKDVMVSLVFLVVCLLLGIAAAWAYQEYLSTPPFVDPDRYPVRGIDVSSHNGDIDFQKVKEAGMDFVFIKASEGVDFRDPKFRENYRKAVEAGLMTGVYHFFRFDREGVAQAINLIKAIGARSPQMGIAIDVEKHGNPRNVPCHVVEERLSAMIDYLNLLGYRVTLYSNRDGYYDFLESSFQGQPLWICSFSENPINAEWTFWQFDHHGKVDGVRGDVDLNAFCGTREEWDNYLKGSLWPYNR